MLYPGTRGEKAEHSCGSSAGKAAGSDGDVDVDVDGDGDGEGDTSASLLSFLHSSLARSSSSFCLLI